MGKLFDEKVKRIEIRKNFNLKKYFKTLGEVIVTCYNIEAMGKYGFCETVPDSSKPYGQNWVFCSRSCQVNDNTVMPGKAEPYEEATLQYFDTAPKHTLFSGNWEIAKKMHV